MPKLTKYEKCSSSNASTTRQYGFNLTTEDIASQVWRFLDSAPAASRGRFRGEVNVERGLPSQSSDIEVIIIATSNDKEDLENVVFHPTESSLGLEYLVTDKAEICTDVQVFIYLRPWPKRLLYTLEVRSNILDINFKDKLNWNIDNLIIQNLHGDSNYNSSNLIDPLMVQNITITSTTGSILGTFVANGNLNLRSVDGWIGCILSSSYGGNSFQPESISVSTVLGDIHVIGKSEYSNWPKQPYTHVTNVHSRRGEVWAYLPHGSITNVSSIESPLGIRLQPFGTASPTDRSEIYTYGGRSGDHYVQVNDAELNSLDGFHNPLKNTISKHYLGLSGLTVKYPYSWYGRMEAQIKNGPINFDSSALEDFERGEGYVKARRGKDGESQLEISVGNGSLDIELGLSDM
ncbi:hypothetical protein GQ44DRAFT_678704 [Phaeosphaeriaceae sp. PMI808]|nr:hypothetical protein GQ44DRAFT_678704 [Phaeosphaeriaceae sp. PMI808]